MLDYMGCVEELGFLEVILVLWWWWDKMEGVG